MTQSKTLELVQDYYGKVLSSTKDLKTSACCVAERLPPKIAAIVGLIHEEVRSRFYGCGVIAPAALTGKTVLDLGCGTGRDVYVLSKLVGPQGRVIGLDMTDEQLAIAKRHQDYHAKAFGFEKSNVTFLKGFIEDLEGAGISTNSIDLVVSNCVINLSPAKDRVFREIMRVLKPGGELHFSDVFVDRRLDKAAMEDPVLLGECLGGALYFEDFRRMMIDVGCKDPRTLSSGPISLSDAEIVRKVGHATFTSRTIRAFKVDLEDRCEDYGQVATYKGTMPDAPNAYRLDDHHLFEAHRPMLVCSNTAHILAHSRLGQHFEVQGDESRHFGLFSCGPAPAASADAAPAGGCC